MKLAKYLGYPLFRSKFQPIYAVIFLFFLQSCSTFKYRTYDEEANKNIEDPEPNYNVTLDKSYQDFISYMYIGNRIENFSTYFNTYFNARENFDDAYQDYVNRVLSVYSDRLDSIFIKPSLSQESIDKFNAAIEKASKIIQSHKSSQFMDKSVLLVGQAYYYLGDYLKAERKFSEFISKLPASSLYDEAVLFIARTQMRLDNIKPSLEKLDELIAKSKDRDILSGAYQSKAEYYISIKDYDNAIKNFKKAIEFSTDSEFKAQMQFIVATVTERFDTKKAANEFDKVMDYGVSFDLEYLARYNNVKNMIANNEFSKSIYLLEDLEVKYKDIVPYLAEVNYLKGTYYEQKKEMRKALEQYYYVIQNFPTTKPSSDASYRIAQYEENIKKDYLHAYMYYKFSTEQSVNGSFFSTAGAKARVYKRYFDLRSTIEGITIKTDYDSTFRSKTSLTPLELQNEEFIDPGKETGKPGGHNSVDQLFADSLKDEKSILDSIEAREKSVSQAKYELAELFLYDLGRADSCEYYLINAFDNSSEYEFKAKVLYALANLYRNTERESKSDEVLKQIIMEYPSSEFAASSKRLLNMYVEDEDIPDPADSLFVYSEKSFLNKSYTEALDGFRDIAVKFPDSKYTDRSLYASGWIYENILMKPDSAYMYYFSLTQKAPQSEFTALISPKIMEYENLLNLNIDSTGIKDTTGIIDTTGTLDTSKSGIIQPENKEEQMQIDGSQEPGENQIKEDDPAFIKEEKKETPDDNK
jgi:tetratricopeptide (TPR) repeat protein